MSYLLVSIRDHTDGLSFIFQVKKYRIAERGRQSPMLEGRQNASMKYDLDLKLAMLTSMSTQEAATYAAQAFAKVEALLDAAEEATEEAEAAEADAAEATPKMVILAFPSFVIL